MPALQVKDCPVDTYEKLRACAAAENRSISQQALTIIQDYLAIRERGALAASQRPTRSRAAYLEDDDGFDYAAKFKQTLERIQKLPPIPISEQVPDTVEILAQIRGEEMR